MPRFLSLSSSLLVLVVAASGCSAPGEDDDGVCPARSHLGRVASINGTTVAVQVLSPSYHYAVLHTAGADFHYYAGSMDACLEAFRSTLAVGQEIEFFVAAWEKSEPPQADVADIVIRG